MFLPLGDDVDTRTLPTVGIALVGINLLVFCAMVGMAVDYTPARKLRGSKTHGGLVAAIEGFDLRALKPATSCSAMDSPRRICKTTATWEW